MSKRSSGSCCGLTTETEILGAWSAIFGQGHSSSPLYLAWSNLLPSWNWSRYSSARVVHKVFSHTCIYGWAMIPRYAQGIMQLWCIILGVSTSEIWRVPHSLYTTWTTFVSQQSQDEIKMAALALKSEWTNQQGRSRIPTNINAGKRRESRQVQLRKEVSIFG